MNTQAPTPIPASVLCAQQEAEFVLLPSLPKAKHKFQDQEGEMPDILVFTSDQMRDYARNAVVEYRAAVAAYQDPWQPITHAPKDGTLIDLWDALTGKRIADVRWIKPDRLHGYPDATWCKYESLNGYVEQRGDFTYFMRVSGPEAGK